MSLVPASNIVSSGLGKSSKAKAKQADRLLREYSAKHGLGDPEIVSERSSDLVINLLYEYSGMKTGEQNPKTLKSREAVSGMVNGLRWTYRTSGHTEFWSVRTENNRSIATGNPLEGNPLIAEFRRAHAKQLSAFGKVIRSAPPLSPELIIEHARKYLCVSPNRELEKMDVLLHAILLASMNTGMRYDEFSKIRLADVKCTAYGTSFGISERCKNSLNFRGYTLRAWPGTHFSQCYAMDPFSALTAWLIVRGDCPGFLFCTINGTGQHSRIDPTKPWPRTSMIAHMHQRFSTLGFGEAYSHAFTGHSAKRGGVQLLRFLGCKDQYIMHWFKMTGSFAYLRYIELCNHLGGNSVPDFSSFESMFSHLTAQNDLDKILELCELDDVEEWLNEA